MPNSQTYKDAGRDVHGVRVTLLSMEADGEYCYNCSMKMSVGFLADTIPVENDSHVATCCGTCTSAVIKDIVK